MIRKRDAMQIITSQPALLRALSSLGRAIQESPYLPVLSHVLLQVERGRVRLSATNLETALTCDLVATDAADGAVCVPWKRLVDLVEHLPNAATIGMETQKESSALAVRSGNSRAIIYGMHASEFPDPPGSASVAATGGVSLTLASSMLLASMLHKVSFAASKDDKPEPILTGILLYASGQWLTLTARDAHRLAACTVRMEAAVPHDCAAVLPAGAAAACEQALSSVRPAAPVQLVIEEQRALLSLFLPAMALSTRLSRGTYPMGFQRYVKPNYLTRAVVETKRLAGALRPLASLANDGGDLVTMTFTSVGAGDAVVTVGAQSQDLGRQAEEVAAVSLEGETGGDLLLKYSQLTQIMAVLDAPYLALDMRGPLDPVAVRPVGGGGPQEETYVLVPCTLKQGVERNTPGSPGGAA
jgi:DNA polymerase III subunit beta